MILLKGFNRCIGLSSGSNTLGSGQSMSFTYTGGGCGTTAMSWVTDHYEGTCATASGWTEGTDTVTVSNTVPDSVANMVLVDLGLPPGFELIDTELRQAVELGTLQKIEKTARQLTLYIEAIPYDEPLTLTYQLRALYPVAASSGESEAHPYYTPSDSTQVTPTDFLVTE